MIMIEEIPFSQPFIDDNEIKEVINVLKGKWITTGEKAKEFENLIKDYLNVNTALGVSSGTAAIDISLASLGIGKGDDVITTAYTFSSTVLSIIHRNATPILVDIDKDTFNISYEKIKEKIDKEYILKDYKLYSKITNNILKAILVVHYGGQACEIEKINKLAKKYNLFVIEDAAHSIGAKHKNILIGKSDNLVCFSFYSNKNITTGEGGMIVTDNRDLEDKLRKFSLHGITKSNIERYKTGLPFYDVIYPGFKYNMSDVLAAIGVAQIKKLNKILELRNTAAEIYNNYLKNIEEIQIPIIKNYNFSSRHLYPILINDNLKDKRDEIIIELKKRGISTSVHFIPVHKLTYFKNYFKENNIKNELPLTEYIFSKEISLPIFPEINENQIKYIVNNLKMIISELK